MAITSRMVEFHRFGKSPVLLSPDTKYIRTCGWDDVVLEVSPTLEHEAFLDNFSQLRYEDDVQKARESMDVLGAEADRFLAGLKPDGDGLLQIDLVTNANELWAFPFEACFVSHKPWLDSASGGVVLTRRIRGDFLDEAPSWPDRPRV